ncbi:hypothetical protein Hanom_Chr07g00640631 [Helianthus anomalus]
MYGGFVLSICLLLAEDTGFKKYCWDVINVSKLKYGMDKFPFFTNFGGMSPHL